MISGEGLRRSSREVLGTLLHEAAHALAHARGIKDTSRQGRYHNKHFKTSAEELGLTVTHDDHNGWSASTITPATELAYTRQLNALTDAMTLWRHGETITGPTARRNTNLIAAACPCGRVSSSRCRECRRRTRQHRCSQWPRTSAFVRWRSRRSTSNPTSAVRMARNPGPSFPSTKPRPAALSEIVADVSP